MTNPVVKIKYPADLPISYDDLKKNVLAVDIYYDKLEYTKISEVPNMRLIELVSNIGGCLSNFQFFKISMFLIVYKCFKVCWGYVLV